MQTAIDSQDHLLTVPEVAKALRLDPTTVGKLCRDGYLGAIRVGRGRGRWRIPAEGLKAYNEARTPSVEVVRHQPAPGQLAEPTAA